MKRIRLASGTIFAVILAVLSASPAFANTITVTNTADSGPGSLRDAIASAASGDTINFSLAYPATITLASTLAMNTTLTISGPAASSLAISGNNAVEVFYIPLGVTASISGVTIEKGSASYGGGNYNGQTIGGGISNGGTLTLINCTLSGNSAFYGGGIWNDGGTVTLNNSTLSGNSASYGGGIYSRFGVLSVANTTLSANSINQGGGGIAIEGGTVTVNNSTLSGNSAGYGGAISNGGTLTVTNSTFSGNSASSSGDPSSSFGGDVWNGENAKLKNAIFANSSAGGNCYIDAGTITSQGHNLSDDGTCSSFLNQIGDLNGTPGGLDPGGLQNHGGPTQTIALLATSPAVDAIPVSPINYCTATDGTTPIATDQRGVTRPQGPACDIGAFELAPYAAEVQPPINSDGSSVFTAKRGVVPVKFTLTYGGVATCQLPPATISLNRTAGTTTGSVDESVYLSASDSGSNFRIDTTNCQYVYNLSTKSLGTGTYQVNISINGSVVGSATFGLQ